MSKIMQNFELQHTEYHEFRDEELVTILRDRITDYMRLPAFDQESILLCLKDGIRVAREEHRKTNLELVSDCQDLKDKIQSGLSKDGPTASDLDIMQRKKCRDILYFQRDGANLIIHFKYDDKKLLVSNRGSSNGELRGDRLREVLLKSENQNKSILDAIADQSRIKSTSVIIVAAGCRNWIKSSEDSLEDLNIPTLDEMCDLIHELASKKTEAKIQSQPSNKAHDDEKLSFFNLITSSITYVFTSIISLLLTPLVKLFSLFFTPPPITNTKDQALANIHFTSGAGKNCLFRAVAYHLTNRDFHTNNAEAAKLRQQACDYIERHPPTEEEMEILKITRDDLTFDNLGQYLSQMRQSTLAGDLEIKALMEILNRDIIVLRKNPTTGQYSTETHGPYIQGERGVDGRYPQTNTRIRPADGAPIVVEYDGSAHYSQVSLADGVTIEQLLQAINPSTKEAVPAPAQPKPNPVVEAYIAGKKVLYQQVNAPELRLLREYSDQARSARWCRETGRSLTVVPHKKSHR